MANGCFFAITGADNVACCCVVLPIELCPTDKNAAELSATVASTAVAAADGTSASVPGLNEDPASSLEICSLGAPCSFRWSATARRLRKTLIPGLRNSQWTRLVSVLLLYLLILQPGGRLGSLSSQASVTLLTMLRLSRISSTSSWPKSPGFLRTCANPALLPFNLTPCGVCKNVTAWPSEQSTSLIFHPLGRLGSPSTQSSSPTRLFLLFLADPRLAFTSSRWFLGAPSLSKVSSTAVLLGWKTPRGHLKVSLPPAPWRTFHPGGNEVSPRTNSPCPRLLFTPMPILIISTASWLYLPSAAMWSRAA